MKSSRNVAKKKRKQKRENLKLKNNSLNLNQMSTNRLWCYKQRSETYEKNLKRTYILIVSVYHYAIDTVVTILVV